MLIDKLSAVGPFERACILVVRVSSYSLALCELFLLEPEFFLLSSLFSSVFSHRYFPLYTPHPLLHSALSSSSSQSEDASQRSASSRSLSPPSPRYIQLSDRTVTPSRIGVGMRSHTCIANTMVGHSGCDAM